MARHFRRAVIAGLALAVSACAKSWDDYLPHRHDGTDRARAGLAPPYGSTAVPGAYEFTSGYRIGAGDRLTVRVIGQADLSGDYNVDGSGNIAMPLIRSVRVGGLTAPEAERSIAERLREGYVKEPRVALEVASHRPFFILGEVQKAGHYAYLSGMTVQNAIAVSGGYTPRANQGDILLTRRNAQGTTSAKVPVTELIYPGDVIYVPERWF